MAYRFLGRVGRNARVLVPVVGVAGFSSYRPAEEKYRGGQGGKGWIDTARDIWENLEANELIKSWPEAPPLYENEADNVDKSRNKSRKSKTTSGSKNKDRLYSTGEMSSCGRYVRGGEGRTDYPIISLSEVKKHWDLAKKDMWCTFRGNVYDMSGFKGHPGLATRLAMVGGNDVEPFWEVYPDHYRGHVIPWMDREFKIGEMTPPDAKEARNFTFADAYWDEPTDRHPDLLPCTTHPYNGEARLDRVAEQYITPNELHYVRTHLPVPNVEEKDFEFKVCGNGVKNTTFTLNDLKTKFKKHEVIVTLQCAGNRREDFHDRDGNQVFIGPHWVTSAVGTAKWGGCRMRDVLKYCGMDVDAMALRTKDVPADMQHVHFEAYDHDETGLHFGTASPMDKVIDPFGDSLLAYEMNDEPLSRDHGYPLRGLLPGFCGNKSAKWIREMKVAEKTSTVPTHAAYRHFAPDLEFETEIYKWTDSPLVTLKDRQIVYNMPVQSVICNPPQRTVLGGNADYVEVKGWAWSGGGRGISRVDVSCDGGEHFTEAELFKPIKQHRDREWGWFLFSKKIPIPEAMKERLNRGERVKLNLCSKAVNMDFNVQPKHTAPNYNPRGVCVNGWYFVDVTVDPNAQAGTVKRPKDFDGFLNKPSGGNFASPWGEPDKEAYAGTA